METNINTNFVYKIPKIIHQIWIGPNKKPDIWMDTFAKDYIKENPEWKYMLWTEKEIDELNLFNKEFYKKEPKLAVKADIVRYEILRKYGGVYVDADSVWINNKSFDDLLELSESTGFFCALEPDLGFGKILANGTIGCVPNHLIINNLVQNVKIRYDKLGNHGARHVIVGPCYLTDTVNELGCDKITILPSITFYPMFWGNINDINLHKKIQLPKESYCFQYGYSSSNLAGQINKLYLDNFDDYIFFPRLDSEGYDVNQFKNYSVVKLKEICDKNPSCVGFNTNGWIKYNIVPENKMVLVPDFNETQGTYVKKSFYNNLK